MFLCVDISMCIRESIWCASHTLFSVCFSESRYLLILTENYAALSILQQELLASKDAIVIFGSSFPNDQQYTQVTLFSNSS